MGKIDRWLQFDSLTWLKYRFLFFDICCTSHGKSVMAKSPGLAITKEREMGKCDASCPPPAAPAPHPHPPPHRQQMLQFRKFPTAPQMSTVRSGKKPSDGAYVDCGYASCTTGGLTPPYFQRLLCTRGDWI